MRAPLTAEWMPLGVRWRDGRPVVEWFHAGEARFTDPFFAQTVERRLAHPFALLFRRETPVEALAEACAARPGLAPTGFIFHMSRCGSTLLAQMLAALPEHLVLSEPEPVDGVLRGRAHGAPEDDLATWLRWMIGALGRPRAGSEVRYFVKLDSWHALELPLLRRAFPDVPWVFLHRDPVEVIASHHRQTAAQMLPGIVPPERLGLDLASAALMSADAYGAHLLARVYEAALRARDSRALFLDYRALPEPALGAVLEHCGVPCGAEERRRMLAAARFDAKNPAAPFVADSAAKQREASAELRRLVAARLGTLAGRLRAAGAPEVDARV